MTDIPEHAESREPSGAERMFGEFAPALVGYTDDVLFGQVWKRAELSPKERSLVTVAALTTGGSTDQLSTTSVSPRRTAPANPSSSR